MKRITTNDDIRFPISVVKGLDSDVFTIQFYTTSKSVNVTKTNADVVDGIIHLEWTELYPLGTGVMNYTVLIPEEDGSYSDDTFNRSISGTTIFYIVSNIIVPDGDDAQNLIDIVAELDTKLDAEIARSTGKDSEHEASLAGKANKNGSSTEAFNTLTLNLRREGANTSLYNYNINGEEYVSFYDQTGGSLTYHFTPNQGDNIATERQLEGKANSSDVYTKAQVDLFLEGSEGILEEPTEKIPKYSTAHPIRILGIGNSYMTEGTRELEGFLTAEGLTEDDLDLEIAYYPARTLEAWYEAIRDGGGYEQLVQFKYNSGNHKWYRTAEHNVADIRDTISGKAWDLIVLQEFPSFSNDNPSASEYYSYYETLSSVITLCKSLCPNASVEFGWHMIWSNDQYITNNYMVWEKICDASMRTAKLSDVSFIIPSATALQNAYNTSYFRGYEHHFLLMDQIGHPAAGAARYIISATWFESLIAPIFGRSLIGNGYVPSFISDGTVTYQDAEVEVNSGNVLLAKLCAISSILDKYDVNYELEKKLNLYYTKTQTDALLNNKADRTGSNQYNFTVKKLGLQNEGAAMVLYNYIFDNHDVIEFYDNEGGTLQYVFSGNNDKIATERQLALKANSADVYTKGEVDTALTGKANTSDVYTKGEVDTALSGKANKNGSNSQSFTANAFNLQKDGASTTLYNYKDANNREFVSFYDQTGGSLTYQFTANQGDNIATERQVNSVSSRVTTLENAGYLTSESDPTVPAWAKAENKPTYTASEVGALPDTTTIPSKVSDLTNDLGFVTGSKIYVGTCETAAATMPKVCTVETFPTDTNGKPLLGTVISVKFTATNTGTSNRGLNVNGTGSASVWYNTGVTTSNNYYGYAGRYITYMWDGTNWVFLTWGYDTNTTYTNVALGQGYAVQSNASASATITATLSSYTLTANGIVSVKFNYDVPANATLNINAKGAKAIYNKNAAITAGVIKAGDTATFIYNTYYRLIAVDSWQDNTGGGGSGTGEGKIVLYAIVDDEDDSICTIQDTEYETLTCSAVKALLNDPTKDVVLRTYDPYDDPNYKEYRLYSYYDDSDYEMYGFFYSDGSNIYTIDLEATRSYTDTWEYYPVTYTIPTSPGKLGFGFGTQNNTSTSSVSATVSNYKKVVGGIVAIKFTKTLAHAPQLNINGTGSSYIYFRGAFCPANTIQSGDIVTLMYTSSGTYEILSITTNRSNDASNVTYTLTSGIIRVDNTRYKTYKIQDYSTTVPSGTTGIQFRFSKNTDYNTEPVTTLILRAENYSKIDWSTLDCSFYSYLSGTSTEVTIKWKDNDSPVNTLAHLGNGVDYVVIKVYEGEYGTYEAW